MNFILSIQTLRAGILACQMDLNSIKELELNAHYMMVHYSNAAIFREGNNTKAAIKLAGRMTL